MNMQEFEQMLHQDIPLTRAMGIAVDEYQGNDLYLSAPLSINANHKNTFFGGSLYTVAVTAGWGLMFLKMKELGFSGHVVINESNIKYLAPVDTDVIGHSHISEDQMKRLEKQLSRRGKAVMSLDVNLGRTGASEQVVFTGRYAIV